MEGPVARVIVFAELSPRAKAQYTRFLIENNVQFARRPSDGRYVANVRLEAPRISPSKTLKRTAKPLEERSAVPTEPHGGENEPALKTGSQKDGDEGEESARYEENDKLSENDAPSPPRRLSGLIEQFGPGVQRRPSAGTYTNETKLVRLMNDIYDARGDDTMEVDTLPIKSDSFPAFVRYYLKTRFGLRSLVEQQARELIEALNKHTTRLDVELFCSFLEEKYDKPALEFFLKARGATYDELAIANASFRPTTAASAKRRNNSHSVQRRRASGTSKVEPSMLSKSQIDAIAQKCFGLKTDDDYLKFVYNVRSYLRSQATPRSIQELLDVNEFLFLAVETFAEMHREQLQARAAVRAETAAPDSSIATDDLIAFSDTSPSPSPLPPPPPPQTFDFVRAGDSIPRQSTKPVSVCLHSKPEVATAETDEVQQRLGSLLMRMQQRRGGGT